MAKITLTRLTDDDREQFILDNQRAFRYGAMEEFGMRDDHLEEDGEIISRRTIEHSIDGGEANRIREDDRIVGYAMACFWDPKGPKNSSYFNDGMLVKAVLFDDHAKGRITEEEVNARLDALYNDYVIGEKLFDTQTENAMHHYGDVLEVVP